MGEWTQAMTPEERFWGKVDRSGPVHPVLGTPCWLWLGRPNADGYGTFKIGGRTRRYHRVSLEWAIGVIPDGLEPDHLCHTYHPDCPGGPCHHRLCVNPEHMELVSPRENYRRGRNGRRGINHSAKTQCPMGHEYDTREGGRRRCSICRNEAARLRYRSKKVSA